MVDEEEAVEPPPKKRRWRWLRVLIVLFILGLLAAGGTVYGVIWHFGRDLPRVDSLAEYRPPLITRVYGRNGDQLLAEFCEERR
ncbi:MAG: hypothetical protein CMH58_05855, partial [Myxococcales bacterium]|nr:hypothetical protein [Myxococcales bacterium]